MTREVERPMRAGTAICLVLFLLLGALGGALYLTHGSF